MNTTDTVPVTIYGASDDLFELDTPDRSVYEEYDCYDRPCTVRLTAPNGEGVTVRGYFTGDWEVGVHEVDGLPNADWRIEDSVRPDDDRDPAIIVHVPVGTTAEEI